jgi:hypothetical protein
MISRRSTPSLMERWTEWIVKSIAFLHAASAKDADVPYPPRDRQWCQMLTACDYEPEVHSSSLREMRKKSMPKIQHALQCCLVGLAVMVASVLVAPGWAATGTINVEIAKAGFIVGIGGGRGTLVFQGRRYPLRVGGLSFGATIGASKADLVGQAYNLRRASDIAGTYTAVAVGAAAGGGASTIRLQNAKGVVLDLRGRSIGLELNANVSGVEISLR